MLDNIGLTIAGHQVEEVRALVTAWNPPDGPAQLFGTGRLAGVDDAAWLNGVAVCVHDLDEGNKFSRGHPITHVISAAVAVATERGATGRQLLEAVMVGGEIAARFGRAMRPTTGLHTHGHFKRHASCSYTHPPADAALKLRTQMGAVDPQAIDTIEVATHRLAAPLNRTYLPTRLAAMFSIPYVVAIALLHGDCGPRRFDEAHRADRDAHRLLERTHVVTLDSFDARLPGERAARVSVRLVDGRVLTAEVPNPIGDADHHPFGRDEILAKLDDLFLDGSEIRSADVAGAIEELPQAADVAAVFARLG